MGLLFYDAPVVGAVTAPWSCTPDEPATPLTEVAVVDDPVPSTTTPTTGSTTSVAPTTTAAPTTTTTWPAGPTTPACAILGLWSLRRLHRDHPRRHGVLPHRADRRAWWLVDPDGHPFFSQGINHTTFTGTPDRYGNTPYHDAAVARYGTAERWAEAQLERMDEWGYNTLGAERQHVLRRRARSPAPPRPHRPELSGPGRCRTSSIPGGKRGSAPRPPPPRPCTGTTRCCSATGQRAALWGWMGRELHLFDSYLSWPLVAPGKQQLLAFLHDRYPTFDALRRRLHHHRHDLGRPRRAVDGDRLDRHRR